MFLINKYDLLFTISILIALLPFRVSGEVVDFEQDWKSGWSVTGFNGWFTDDATITQTLKFEKDLDSSYRFAGVALNKRFLTLWSRLEIEGSSRYSSTTAASTKASSWGWLLSGGGHSRGTAGCRRASRSGRASP